MRKEFSEILKKIESDYVVLKHLEGTINKNSNEIDILCNAKFILEIKNILSSSQIIYYEDIIRSRIGFYNKDNEILVFDCVKHLMYKNFPYFKRSTAFSSGVIKDGVKYLELSLDLFYISHFYVLNNTLIPEHYFSKNYKEINKFFFYISKFNIYNLIIYIKSLFSFPIIIELYGLDGSGKSTVQELLTSSININYGLRVKKRRIRPNILPRLGFWKKSNIIDRDPNPHKGNNNSTISSFLRYLYYNIDYFLGSFFDLKIFTKSDVIIYDRGKLDFQLDPKRYFLKDNKMYWSISYPLFSESKSYYLFDDIDTLLSRKKELKKETMEVIHERFFNKSGLSNIRNRNLDIVVKLLLKRVFS